MRGPGASPQSGSKRVPFREKTPRGSGCSAWTEYRAGEVLPRDTGTCLECVCGAAGRVTCSPRDCASEDAHPPAASLDMFDVDTF
ncbi:Uncharacterized protein GBIM_10377 [Gryllus bimaculatus]|nr:Uncharacterized protein GBIM_10377 [Gryllus bimaculatus]